MNKQGLYNPIFEHDACGIGMIANIDGTKDHQIVDDALTVLENLNHRGAEGADAQTGDGAGILVQIPDEYYRDVVNFDLPVAGTYAVMQLFLSQDDLIRERQFDFIKSFIKTEGYDYLGQRDVPILKHAIGQVALSGMPYLSQVFISKEDEDFELNLYQLRKKIENHIKEVINGYFYIASLSSQTVVYKGMFTSLQLRKFYPDLENLNFKSAVALVHARFSTNTFPSWERAHPNRFMIHNGEINTIHGNVNWMTSRQNTLKHQFKEIEDTLPIVDESGSDSSIFDNALEFLIHSGRSLPHAMMMMIPEPWENDPYMNKDKKAFYEFHNFLMEPWEGPAAIVATDGKMVVASLDRNGLRPSRYLVTKQNRIILASEVGVLDIKPEDVLYKGRLTPGKILAVDLDKKRMISDEEVKMDIATKHPYQSYIDKHLVNLSDFETSPTAKPIPKVDLLTLQKAYGYTIEDIDKIIKPMAENASEAIGSMGYDAPLAILSEKPQILYHYFKHAFAQVTNPPLDGIREKIVTSSKVMLGSIGHLLKPLTESNYAMLLDGPILSNGQLKSIKNLENNTFKTKTLSTLYDKSQGAAYAKGHLDKIYQDAFDSYQEGYNLFIISDRGLDQSKVSVPMFLAASGLHHFFIEKEIRTDISIVVETADAREIHHFAALFGHGVTAINPYLVFETLKDLVKNNKIKDLTYVEAKRNYIKAATKGIMKISSKMGISTLRSYHGSQLFEAVGISEEVINQYFNGTISRLGGLNLTDIAYEMHKFHDEAFETDLDKLDPGSRYFYKRNGEQHLLSPEMIRMIHTAAKNNDYEVYKQLSDAFYNMDPVYLRHLFKFKDIKEKIDIKEVESVESILKRFKSGAMSYGSISQEAHETIAIAMNMMGGKSNSGEGGEDPSRYELTAEGHNKASAIKQIASGRFGVTSEYLNEANEIQIKMAQGAKPGEGGHLPGKKVHPWIAKTRYSTPGVGLISPPPHHDIYSIEDLAELIYDLKKVNHKARINVKLVSQAGVGTVAVGVAKGKADVILISGYDGGTGAAPQTSKQHAGLPWEIGLSEVHQTLTLNKLRNRVTLETDGKLLTGRDVAVAAILGAEEYGFATLPLVLVGCVMIRSCQNNNCPVGIATQDERLRKKFKGEPIHIINYFRMIAEELREIMASLGVRTVNELIGRHDFIEMRDDKGSEKTRTLDFSKILYNPDYEALNKESQEIDSSFDEDILVPLLTHKINHHQTGNYYFNIKNIHRSVGSYIGSMMTKTKYAFTDDFMTLNFKGSAGQSFGAFIPKGLTLKLEGDTNDYLGKGLSGGKIVIKKPEAATYKSEDNIITGNVSFYGATSGEAYIEGMSGERFAVRNSGANLVVEGTGDHACEYMTGGHVVILGKTGKNIAAGMSGGYLYIKDLDETLLNTENVEIYPLLDEDIEVIKKMLKRHVKHTDSALAKSIIDSNDYQVFKKIVSPTFFDIVSQKDDIM